MLPFRLNGIPSQADASPSISLERGGYRMRAPRPVDRPPPLDFTKNTKAERVRSQKSHALNKGLVLLLFLITFASIACFGAAYYLFTFRWERYPSTGSTIFANAPIPVNGPVFDNESRSFKRNTTEDKYLAYLPHSGFHNQRIAFENALVLARIFNRTLLVPPVYLGNKPLRYVPFNTLSQHLVKSSRRGLKHCPNIPPYISLPVECLRYFDFAQVSWNQIFDLSAIEAQQRLQYLPDLSPAWTDPNFTDSPSDVFIIRDESPYQYRFLDEAKTSQKALGKFEQHIYISDLKRSTSRLLQIGTLFGSSRLQLVNPTSVSLQENIRKEMVFNHPDLVKAMTSIRDRLSHSYIGAHLRVSDGEFLANSQTNVDSIWGTLLQRLGYGNHDILGIAKLFHPEFTKSSMMYQDIGRTAGRKTYRNPSIPRNFRCRNPLHSNIHHQALNDPLYISTDLRNPHTHPLLAPYRQTFPCIFFLSDFPHETRYLHNLMNPHDGVPLYSQFLPFLDAMVVANAEIFVGTNGSTFSTFIKQILWPTYHIMEDPSQI